MYVNRSQSLEALEENIRQELQNLSHPSKTPEFIVKSVPNDHDERHKIARSHLTDIIFKNNFKKT